jgi:hypothetical protein
MQEVKSFKDDPAKELWREKTVAFMQKHSTPRKLKDLKVLCLSGREMIEPDRYIAAGIRPSNIFSVEKYPDEFRALKAENARREKPINIIQGDLLEFFKDSDNRRRYGRFDHISLDFLGNFNFEKINILHYMEMNRWLNDRGTVITNFFAGRESMNIQYGFVKTKLIHKGIITDLELDKIDSQYHQDKERFMEEHKETFQEVKSNYDLFRSGGAQYAMYYLSLFSPTLINSPFYVDINNATHGEEMARSIADSIRDNKLPYAVEHISKNIVEQVCSDSLLSRVVGIYLLHKDWPIRIVDDHESYSYIGNTGKRMISDMCHLTPAVEAWSPKVPFLLRGKLHQLEYKINGTSYEVSTAKHWSDQQWTDFVDYVDEFMGNRNTYVSSINAKTIPRIHLNDLLQTAVEPKEKKQRRVRAQNKPLTRNELRTHVYGAIQKHIPDQEIMDTYKIAKMQLAGYKAQLTKENDQAYAKANTSTS